MRIVAISDTHSYHRKLAIPDADMLIHSGDWSFKGEVHIIEDMVKWAEELPITHKIFVAGNHEVGLQYGKKRKHILELIKNAGLIYLENSSIIIDGLKIYGSPASPFFYAWEFNYNRGKDIKQVWSSIPLDTDILITHGPPYGTLDLVEDSLDNYGRDLHQGCEELAKKIEELKQLKLHCFGHLHQNHGKTIKDNIIYVNASSCNEKYRCINSPIIIDL